MMQIEECQSTYRKTWHIVTFFTKYKLYKILSTYLKENKIHLHYYDKLFNGDYGKNLNFLQLS